MTNLMDMPNEILMNIFKNLNVEQLSNLRLTNSRCAGLIFDDLIRRKGFFISNANVHAIDRIFKSPVGLICPLTAYLTVVHLKVQTSAVEAGSCDFSMFKDTVFLSPECTTLKLEFGESPYMCRAFKVRVNHFMPHLKCLRIDADLWDTSDVDLDPDTLSLLDSMYLKIGYFEDSLFNVGDFPNLKELALMIGKCIESPVKWSLFIGTFQSPSNLLILKIDVYENIEKRDSNVELYTIIAKNCTCLAELQLSLIAISDTSVKCLCDNYHSDSATKAFKTSIRRMSLESTPYCDITPVAIGYIKMLPCLEKLSLYGGYYFDYSKFHQQLGSIFVEGKLFLRDNF